MARAASLWVGEHDFASFHASGREVSSTVRAIRRFVVERVGDEVCFEVEGSGFLYKMVRTMVGTLLEIGRGERDPMAARTIREARDRTAAGPTAPSAGLTLVSVSYGTESTSLTPLVRATRMRTPSDPPPDGRT
jgi:tRNA pseudouridine38-40 synthase